MNTAEMMETLKKQILITEKHKHDLKKAKQQLSYLKNHVDITTLKPTTGPIREEQLELLDFTLKLLDVLKEAGITPFLCSGNLLGAYRHKGFIPWDDDFDFGLMREDYEKLKQFCKKNFIVAPYLQDNQKSRWSYPRRTTEIKQLLKKHPNEYVFEQNIDQIQIYSGTNLLNRKSVDFWPYDVYEESYTFAQWQEYVRHIAARKAEIDNMAAINAFLEEEIRTNPHIVRDNGKGNVFFGIDNVNSYIKKFNTSFMPYEVFFPFRKMPFETTEFHAPNKPEEYLRSEYTDIMSLPDDFGLGLHRSQLEYYIQQFGLD